MTASTAVRTTLPPGPRLPAGIQTLLFGSARHEYFPRWQRRFGHTFTVSLAAGRKLVVITRPADIRTVFAGSATVFHAGEANDVLAPVLGEHAIVLSDGDAHQRLRRLVMPAFTAAALRGYQDLIGQVAIADAESWPTGQLVRAHDRMHALTLEVILRVVFGVSEEERLAVLRPLVTDVVNGQHAAVLGGFFPPLRAFRRYRRFQARRAELNAWLDGEIADRRRAGAVDGTDVLSRLLQPADGELSSAELRDQLFNLLLAGHETTATALGWTLHELARRPQVLRAAQRAADDNDEDYLIALVKEATRLHPVIYVIGRRLAQPAQVGDYLLPAGTVVAPGIGLVQAAEENYPEPAEFRPARFLDGQPATNTWIPFGGGVRRCLGVGFAQLEASLVLREVLARYDITADRPAPEATRVHGMTMMPAGGAQVRVSARR
ncbi:cytochrome P450 [Fodinicola feengrottensis]|uniref:Cytochrome P450 n=1 Tax=Fodinicola feengrottensis TaxID=435914 RepID=A0ABN2IY46_9ACTN|nr:cytochrome P450 [Fodinicola feengrottensis]